MDYKWLESSSVIIRLTLVNWLPAFHNLDCRSNVLLEWVKLPVPFIIRIAEWRCRCVGYGNNFLFHTRLEFTHKSTVVWTFAGKLNQKRIQYVSLDLIRIVGTTLPAYIRIIRERHLAKIEIFIRICRRPQPKFAILIRTFRWPLREFWGVLAAPAVLWWDRVRGIDCPLLCWRIPLLKNSFSKNEETTRHKSKEWGRDNVELRSYKLYKNKAALLIEW